MYVHIRQSLNIHEKLEKRRQTQTYVGINWRQLGRYYLGAAHPTNNDCWVCVYVCMYVCVYACVYVCVYVCTYVRTYVCMYVRMYV